MKNLLRNVVLVMGISILLTACSSNVSPETSMRIYETNSATSVTNAVARAFTKAGYSTRKAKLSTETATTTVDGKKKEQTVSYTYGPAELANSNSRRCMKVASAKVVPVFEKPVYLVELQAIQMTCYRSIKQINVAVDSDAQVYEDYFRALSKELHKEGKRIQAH